MSWLARATRRRGSSPRLAGRRSRISGGGCRPRCHFPNRAFEKDVVPYGRLPLHEVTSIAMVGSPATVREGLEVFVSQTAADELMVVSHIYDHAARVRSCELLAASGV